MQNTTEIMRHCARQCELLSVRAEEMEANNIPATPVRAMIAAYDDVLDFIARPQKEKSRSLREQKEAQK
nr:MAG TPA: hypothetical protein [Caudoviricetes sp.]